jgi:hypothetical protein
MATSIYIKTDTGTKYLYDDGLSGSTTVYIPPGATGTWQGYAERYGYKRQEVTFTPASGGDIPFNPIWVEDVSLSATPVATVAAYTDLGTAQKVNDYEAYWRTTEAGITYTDTLSRNGETIDWTPYDVEIDPLAAVPYSITGNKVTVKALKLTANTVTTTGVVSYVNGGSIDGVVTDINGVTSQTTITGLIDCSVAIFDSAGDLYTFADNQTGSYTISIPPTETGTWSYVVTKQAHKYQTGSFNLGTGVSTNITWTPITDDRIVDATQAIVTSYATLDTTQKMYDYWSYWVTTEEGIPWYETVTWSGDVLDTDGADLDVDPLATELAALDPITHKVTIRTTTLAGDLRTDGLVMRLNGASTSGLVTDSTGTTSIVTFTGFTGTNKLYVEDELDVQRVFETVTTPSQVLYLLPAEQTAGLWTYATKKTGYEHAVGSFSVAGGGRVTVQIGMGVIKQPNGQAMYTGSAPPSGLSVDWTTHPGGDPRILLGDQSYNIIEVYDEVDRSMSSLDGLKWLAAGYGDVRIATLPAGNFVFLTTGWRFMQAVPGNDNAALNAFSISEDAQNVDNVNGPVSLISSTSALADDDLQKLRETWDRLVNHVEPKVDTLQTDLTACCDNMATSMTELSVDLEDIKGTGFVKDKDSLTNHTVGIGNSIALSA